MNSGRSWVSAETFAAPNQNFRLQQVIAAVNACFFLAAAIPVLLAGPGYAEYGLVLFFVPVALAGVIQKRLHLLLTTLASLAVVYGSLFLHSSGLLAGTGRPAGQPGWLAAVGFTVAVCIVALVLDRFGSGSRLALDKAESARRDIEALNRQLAERVGRLTALIQIDAALNSHLGSTEILGQLLSQVRSKLGVDAAAVLEFDRSRTRLRWQNGSGFTSTRMQATVLKLGEGLAGRAALQREPVFVHEQPQLSTQYVRWPLVEDEGFEFYAAMPLMANGELEGVLELFHRSPLHPDEDWREFLTALAGQAALVFNSARLLADLEQSNLELRSAYDTTIEGWSRALDLRDHETEGHSRRVTQLTVELARRMGAPEDRLVHVRRGALLHDIGKMGVPDSILQKPGPLTDEERRQMEQHTVHAFNMLKPIEFLQPALKIPYSHHENWDGSGYPQGLNGTDIPLAARVFSVIDVYDALTNDRPYRTAWSSEEALAHIREQSGRKFDPAVVAEFLAMMAESRD